MRTISEQLHILIQSAYFYFILKIIFLRTITCDAYAAYDTVAKESDGKISVSNCLSHARRRWVYALEVIHPGGYTDEQLKELPEVKALILGRRSVTQKSGRR